MLSGNRRLQALMAAILSDTGGQVGSPLRLGSPPVIRPTAAHVRAGTDWAHAGPHLCRDCVRLRCVV